MLILRELIAGPRRFTDLQDGLPGISTNLLSERLKSLEQNGLLSRRVLPPPAGSTVYDLTPLGRSLEKSLIELGKWGSQFVPASPETAALLNVGSYALTLKTFFRPEQAENLNETYELHIDDELLQVQIKDGEIHVRQGEAFTPDVVFHTKMPTYLRLLTGQISPDQALASGQVRVEGDPAALIRFLSLCGVSNRPSAEREQRSMWDCLPDV